MAAVRHRHGLFRSAALPGLLIELSEQRQHVIGNVIGVGAGKRAVQRRADHIVPARRGNREIRLTCLIGWRG